MEAFTPIQFSLRPSSPQNLKSSTRAPLYGLTGGRSTVQNNQYSSCLYTYIHFFCTIIWAAYSTQRRASGGTADAARRRISWVTVGVPDPPSRTTS